MADNKYCNLIPDNLISAEYTKINDGFASVETDISQANADQISATERTDAHVAGTAEKHAAEKITYSGSVPGAADVKQGIDLLKARVDEIITTPISGEAAAQELVDARGASATLGARLNGVEAHVDKNSPTLINEKMSNLFRQANNGLANVNYIMVGDSTRASNGAHIYEKVSNLLNGLNVTTTLSAQSGLKAENWGSDGSVQPGYPKAADLIALIPGTGSTTIVDISLGLNDTAHTAEEIEGYITAGVNTIKASKPDTIFNLTSSNYWVDHEAGNTKLKQAYDDLYATGIYGYINVLENVFKNSADTTGFYIDLIHPNEYGQKKMAEYIVDKLIPNDLKVDALSYFRVPAGYIKNNVDNANIIESGFMCEVAYSVGTPTGNIYLRKSPDAKWYLWDITSGDSLSAFIEMKNGFQTIGAGWVSGKTISAIVYIRDYAVLDLIASGSAYYLVSNAIVTTLKAKTSFKNTMIDLYDSNTRLNEAYVIRRGYLSSDAVNDPLRESGLRIEVVYSEGAPTGNIYLKKFIADNKWYLWDITSGSSLSASIEMKNGETNITNGGYVAGKTITAKIHIDNVSVLNAITASDATYYPITNGIVTAFSTAKTIKEHIQGIYDLLIN